MRAALSLLFFSAVLFLLPCVAPATESAQANITAGVSEPSDGAMARLFGWFRSLGNLKIEGDVADDESKRYQDGQYVFWNGGSKGYHFVADLTPDFQPGFYIHSERDKSVAADLSLMDPSTGGETKNGLKEDGGSKVSFFLGPDMDPGFHDDREKGLGPDMPALNVHEGSGPGTDLGVRCGIKCKFD